MRSHHRASTFTMSRAGWEGRERREVVKKKDVHCANGAQLLRNYISQGPRAYHVATEKKRLAVHWSGLKCTYVQNRFEGNFVLSPMSQSMSMVALHGGSTPAGIRGVSTQTFRRLLERENAPALTKPLLASCCRYIQTHALAV